MGHQHNIISFFCLYLRNKIIDQRNNGAREMTVDGTEVRDNFIFQKIKKLYEKKF